MLREGAIDISPSSSIEYLRNKKRYSILPFLSISSEGRVYSILLFSKYPLNGLNGKTVALSSDSDTSVALLKIILREFNCVECKFKKVNCRGVKNPLSTFSAVLLIGDTAMKETKRLRTQNIEDRTQIADNRNSSLVTPHSPLYIYDLGELWHKYTGLPFVFALWIVRNDILMKKEPLVRRLSLDLYNARQYVSKNLPLIAKDAPQRQWLSKKELINYWENISFDLTERHLEGLRLFERYILKNHLL